MADEYIRLDTTIMGIDGLINEAPTGTQARALLCAKDMIYDLQRYVSEMEPVKRGKWIGDSQWYKCSVCTNIVEYQYSYCPHCGVKINGYEPPETIKG